MILTSVATVQMNVQYCRVLHFYQCVCAVGMEPIPSVVTMKMSCVSVCVCVCVCVCLCPQLQSLDLRHETGPTHLGPCHAPASAQSWPHRPNSGFICPQIQIVIQKRCASCYRWSHRAAAE